MILGDTFMVSTSQKTDENSMVLSGGSYTSRFGKDITFTMNENDLAELKKKSLKPVLWKWQI